MKTIKDIFCIRSEERCLALVLLAIIVALNVLVICKYYELFTPLSDNYWKLFINNFHISGFDPITLSVVSNWHSGYTVFRHPMLAFFMYVPYLINQALMWLTGINCAVFIVATIQVFCAFYSGIFIYRIFRQVVQCSRAQSTLLTFFFFSLAFVLVTSIVPDHFVISMMLLLLTLWVTGRKMLSGRPMTKWQTFVLFVLTAGTSLNNGAKTFLAALFANGKRFFRPAFLFLAVALPAALVWETGQVAYHKLVWPGEMARKKARAERAEAQKKRAQEARLAQAKKDTLQADSFLALATSHRISADSARVLRITADSIRQGKHHKAAPAKKRSAKLGVPIAKEGYMSWTDISTSRLWSIIENLFGESIQLHRDHLLEDEFRSIPMIIQYRSPLSYVVEALVVALFVIGIWCGRRSKFMWLCFSFFALDMALHIGLGFGINEVYIMSAHWIYVIPIAAAFALKSAMQRWGSKAFFALTLLTIYLWVYNVSLIVTYLVSDNFR